MDAPTLSCLSCLRWRFVCSRQVNHQPRLIDGLVLTKFDTISDKVGAALSLVYTTGKPIVFVGVGQTYEDIRNLNVEHVVRALTG